MQARWWWPLGIVLVMAACIPASGSPTDAYVERTVSVPEAGTPVEFRYRLLRPAAVESGRTYPVILFLHGAGERGSDNEAQLPYLPTWMAEEEQRTRHPCFVIAPQCRAERKWVDADWSKPEIPPHKPEPTVDLAAAVAALDAVLRDEPADPARVYLTGISMGGFGTWDLAARMPDRFAALLPICGGGDVATAARMATIPTWCFHGERDELVRVQVSRDMIGALEAAGGTPRYSELKGVGHDSWTPAYRDSATLDWLFRQRLEERTRAE